METIMVDMMPLNVGVDEIWCNLVAQRARACERQATLRERSVISAAFESKSEKVWALADRLFGMLPDGAVADRMRIVREIESELAK